MENWTQPVKEHLTVWVQTLKQCKSRPKNERSIWWVEGIFGLALFCVGLGVLLSACLPASVKQDLLTTPDSSYVLVRNPITDKAPRPEIDTPQTLQLWDEILQLEPSTVDQSRLTIPDSAQAAGIYWPSQQPGTGVAVISAHLDWEGKPGAFAHLHQLKVNDRIRTYTNGQVQIWQVQSKTTHLQGRLPQKVFSPQAEPALALVTCAGPVQQGQYTRNLLIWATPVRN